MSAVDTKVLVRWLVRDDEQQEALVAAQISGVVDRGEPLAIPCSVSLGLDWALRSRYRLDLEAVLPCCSRSPRCWRPRSWGIGNEAAAGHDEAAGGHPPCCGRPVSVLSSCSLLAADHPRCGRPARPTSAVATLPTHSPRAPTFLEDWSATFDLRPVNVGGCARRSPRGSADGRLVSVRPVVRGYALRLRFAPMTSDPRQQIFT